MMLEEPTSALSDGHFTVSTMNYVALLRGINVGKRQRIAMADLRSLLADLGYGGVRTLLNSGNAIFSAPKTTAATIVGDIEGAITKKLGLSVRCVVRTQAQLRVVVEQNPLPTRTVDGSRLLVTFLSSPLDSEAIRRLNPEDFAPEEFSIAEKEIYSWHPEGILAMRLSYAFVEKQFGVVATARNWNTVVKLAALEPAD